MNRLKERFKANEMKPAASAVEPAGEPVLLNEEVKGEDEENDGGIVENNEVEEKAVAVVEQLTPVDDLFLGELKSIISYKDSDGNMIEHENTNEFATLYIDLHHKELYEAWENKNMDQIENYKTRDDTEVTAEQRILYSRCPKVLMFQINRVNYINKKLEKLNDRFDFDETIYPDRFFQENREYSTEIGEKVKILKQKANALRSCIQKHTQYKESQVSLVDTLKNTIGFFNESNSDMQIDGEDYVIQTSQIAEKSGVSTDSLKNMTKDLEKIVKTAESELESMKQELDKLQEKIKYSYKEIDKSPYHLHSIFIHEGSAEYGHYYAYSRVPNSDKWHKYNDVHVKEEEHEQVLKDAIGGDGPRNAYCLIYVHKDVWSSFSQDNLRNYGIINRATDREKFDIYGKQVSNELCTVVHDLNDTLMDQVEESKASTLAKEI